MAMAMPDGDARERRTRSNDSDAVLLKRVMPAFPLDAYAACTPGYSVVEFTIDDEGSVTDLTVTESEPPGVFDQAAMAAVGQWKFSPRIVNGAAVSQRVAQQIDFAISSECVIDATLPEVPDPEPFDDVAARKKCLGEGGSEFGFAVLDFRVDENGRPGDVIVVRSTSRDFAHQARDELAGREFDPRYEALIFTHTFAFCVTTE